MLPGACGRSGNKTSQYPIAGEGGMIAVYWHMACMQKCIKPLWELGSQQLAVSAITCMCVADLLLFSDPYYCHNITFLGACVGVYTCMQHLP